MHYAHGEFLSVCHAHGELLCVCHEHGELLSVCVMNMVSSCLCVS